MTKPDKKTIMICDDEEDILDVYKMALERSYDVIIARSGKECIEKYIEEKHNGKKINVLLLDYKLGDMLGDFVACKISEINGVKILLVSAYDLEQKMLDDLIRRRCIVGSLKKPVSLKSIIKQIEDLLKNSD
jgi:CheY-like chemotaxis protein